jgi:hypothetical protein
MQNELELANSVFDTDLFSFDFNHNYKFYTTSLTDMNFYDQVQERYDYLGYFNIKFQ